MTTGRSAEIYAGRVESIRSPAERKLLDAFRTLASGWRVFHSVAWQSSREGRAGDGEADFVLLHPRRGLLVVEVKGGGIEIHDGRWWSVDGRGEAHEIQDPFEQATRSKHVLVRYLRENRPALPFLPAGHAVAFPDVRIDGRLGPEAPREIVLDRDDLEDIGRAIERVADHWELRADLEPWHVAAIVELLAPTEKVRPVLADRVEEARARLIRLTENQFIVLRQLRRNRRALIYGAAGTGKTVLAVERARRLGEDGFRTLLTCYNRPLGEYLAKQLEGAANVEVASFHSLARQKAQEAGHRFPPSPPPGWWDQKLPELLTESADRLGYRIDALVVDEGQDFLPTWWTALQLLLEDPDEGPFYVFADPHQALYRRSWSPPFDGPAFDLFVNCRNTRPIAELVASIFGDELAPVETPGPEPELVEIASKDEIVPAVRKTLQRLVHRERVRPEQIAVLAGDAEILDDLRRRPLAGQTLVEVGRAGLVADSVRRFKGLEADVVVLVLPFLDGRADEARLETARALAYVGMSRARTVLVVIGTPETRRALGLPVVSGSSS